MKTEHSRTDKPGKATAHSPYCSFKNDRERRLALISRDVCRVVIAGILAFTAAPMSNSSAAKALASFIAATFTF